MQTNVALPNEKCNEKLDKYGSPSNCAMSLSVPTMNPEIWDKLTHQAKRKDLLVAAIQKAGTKVGALLTGSARKIMAALADSKKLHCHLESEGTSDLQYRCYCTVGSR